MTCPSASAWRSSTTASIGDDTSLRDRKRADVYEHWLELAADDDFIGVQNYERRWYDGDGEVDPDPRRAQDRHGVSGRAGRARRCRPLRLPTLRRTRARHRARHASHDDTLRAAFIEPSLAGLLDAIDDGVPVLGYLHWSLMDNFEWIFGFDGQLGLHGGRPRRRSSAPPSRAPTSTDASSWPTGYPARPTADAGSSPQGTNLVSDVIIVGVPLRTKFDMS